MYIINSSCTYTLGLPKTALLMSTCKFSVGCCLMGWVMMCALHARREDGGGGVQGSQLIMQAPSWLSMGLKHGMHESDWCQFGN